ncbi:hypothetical protein IJI55_00460 [Candidatus Saccharibacteria bacterium]|nr:hypothetical protein [Candidatus Saccharibacteria bacterium]MBR0403012.1 hypothetical protein [Candidatus Saccharibacteria bacterium]MBR3323559.1 hypothetical protein [Candidatus Saccharibacteria bacterium]
MKKILLACFSLVIAAFPTLSAAALSSEQKSAISANCSSIQQSLRTLQRSDSRTRVYLGSIYQTVLTDYITPLNLRLVKNNQPSATLTNNQSEFAAARNDFSQKFIIYSQALEELILIDCNNRPEDFYHKLTEVRSKRSDLSKAIAKINEILNAHAEAVAKLKGESHDER